MFKIGGSSICFPRYVNGGVIFVNDFLDSKGNLMSFNDFLIKYNINTNFLQYQNIIESIKLYLSKMTFRFEAHKEDNPVQP